MKKTTLLLVLLFTFSANASEKPVKPTVKEDGSKREDLMAKYREMERNTSLITIDNSFNTSTNTFGEEDQTLGLDLILKSLHGLGLMAGFEKGIRNRSKSSQWGFSFGIAIAQDKRKRVQQIIKWRAFSARFFNDASYGEFYTGIDYGLRIKLFKHVSLIPIIKCEFLRRGSGDNSSSIARNGANISAGIGLSFYL